MRHTQSGDPQTYAKVARYQELLNTLSEAGFLARNGQTTAGYNRLLQGLRRGEKSLEAGEPWGEDLVNRYLLAVEGYAQQFRLLPRTGFLAAGLNRESFSQPALRISAG